MNTLVNLEALEFLKAMTDDARRCVYGTGDLCECVQKLLGQAGIWCKIHGVELGAVKDTANAGAV